MQIIEPAVLKTKLAPPRPPRQTLHRKRLTRLLEEAANYRLTIVQAGAGCGKSTALAALVDGDNPLVWYRLEDNDADPQRYLLHLLDGFSKVLPGFSQVPWAMLEGWNHTESSFDWQPIVDAFLNALVAFHDPIIFVLDDVHLLNSMSETIRILVRVIEYAPSCLHLILSTRSPLNWKELRGWRMRGHLLEITHTDLAFNQDEISLLFEEHYRLPLTTEECELLKRKTEGWAMVIPLVWQRLQRGSAASIPHALEQLSGSVGDLFPYLAEEILSQQRPDVRVFLRSTAVLQEINAALCDHLCGRDDSREILNYLREDGLFVFSVDIDTLRYHHLFREFLLSQLPEEEKQILHRRAADYFSARGRIDQTVDHLIAAHAFLEAAQWLAESGRKLVAEGRLETLERWIGSLPPDTLTGHPVLLVYLGDIARLQSRFKEALDWYREAESHFRALRDLSGLGRALRGQARVYLDTVNPRQAEALLEEALRNSDGRQDRESQARLLELLAENRINQGRTADAEALRQQASDLRQEELNEAALPLRLLLRTGRLAEAQRALQELAVAEEEEPVLRPRAHRETLLLLSIVHAFMGQREKAFATAVAGTERGRELESPFVTAVGWMRQGHAWLLLKNRQGYAEAERAFQQAIEVSNSLQTTRLKAEAYWGLCQATGFRGQLQRALDYAQAGISLAEKVGDEWVAACIRVTMGAACTLAGNNEKAAEWLKHGGASFRECNDSHGLAVTLLWHSLLWQTSGKQVRLDRDLAELLLLIRENEYAFLFLRKTLLGPPDPRTLVPLLLTAKERGIHTDLADHLLHQLGLNQLEIHPGYQLRVQALGPFRLWRGQGLVGAKAWQRKKARQLFQLLLTFRRAPMHRDQIVETLWPELDQQSAQRDFKIAFNALCKVLEPDRKRNQPSSFISRDGSRYGIRPGADLWFDVAEFDRLSAAADRQFPQDPSAAQELYRLALALYRGNYLQEFPYEEWAHQERLRLLNRYLRTAERLARSLLSEKKWEEVEEVCQALLEQDNCWEPAYQMLIKSYSQLGNNAQALRTYHRCEENLRTGLNVTPNEKTRALLQDLRKHNHQ